MYYSTPALYSASTGVLIWTIVSAILAIVGGILIYVLFLSKKNEGKFTNKFVTWLYDFLRFDSMMIEVLLKVLYLISALFITLYSFALIGGSFLAFILVLVLGNVSLRIGYELILILIQIWKNTTEIKNNVKSASKAEKADKKK